MTTTTTTRRRRRRSSPGEPTSPKVSIRERGSPYPSSHRFLFIGLRSVAFAGSIRGIAARRRPRIPRAAASACKDGSGEERGGRDLASALGSAHCSRGGEKAAAAANWPSIGLGMSSRRLRAFARRRAIRYSIAREEANAAAENGTASDRGECQP